MDTGRLRAAWHPSAAGLGVKFNFNAGLKSKSQVEEGKKEGRFTNNLKDKNYKYIEMVNAVSYVGYIEYGWSRAAPTGLVRISMRQMRGQLPKELGKEYKALWNQMRKSSKKLGIKGGRSYEGIPGELQGVIGEYREFTK